MTVVAESMAAIQIQRFGGPEVLERKTLPVPVPAAGEVLIKVAYCGVCRHDLLTRAGAFPRAQVPVIPGHQVSGTVAAVGDSVTEFAVGEAVMTMIFVGCGQCGNCAEGKDALCTTATPQFLGEDYDGGYAEYVAVKERVVVAVPAGVGLPEAAILTCTLGTAYHGLLGRGGLKAGETVVITGASGGVGSHAVQIAKAVGATVVGVVSSPDSEALVRTAGADHVIVNAGRKFAKELKALLGHQAHLVLEVVGAPTLRESLHAVRAGGRVVVVGNVEGSEVAVPPAYLILKEISLIGTKSCTKDEMAEVLALIKAGKVRPEVTEIIPLEQVGELHLRMEAEGASGRTVLEVGGA
jgi:acryloyl-coenzyme A reductase